MVPSLKQNKSPSANRWPLVFAAIGYLALGALAEAQEPKLVPLDELDALTVQADSGKLLLNNFNFAIEKALFGGTKATVQCSVKNKAKSDVNYSVYIAALDKSGGVVVCFCLEPTLNTHGAGKVETLETSGLVAPKDKDKVSSFFIKVIPQKRED
jgi:hypothetical protein